MPLVLHEKIQDAELYLWKIDEALQFFCDKLNSAQFSECESFGSQRRKLEYACSRAFIKDLYPNFNLTKTPVGAPKFEGDGVPFLSISHTNDYVAIICSDNNSVAIDVEFLSRDTSKVLKHYLSDAERSLSENNAFPLLAWCAKECVYKFLGVENVDWVRDMQIIDFDFDAKLLKLRAFQDKIIDVSFFFYGDLAVAYII